MERTILNKGPYFNLNGLEYKKQMEVKWLFEAQFNGEDVVVKFFCSHYGTDVHVHGDLRVQNILVVDDSISILDFDWAGKEGEVRYPQELNTSDPHYLAILLYSIYGSPDLRPPYQRATNLHQSHNKGCTQGWWRRTPDIRPAL